ncbi:MAG TPA: malto-oligosyltrehalose trehalohydrolase [Planctomycetaceae bacterium]|nr:malto-oligosyltrehalose trehalohydrolase [Planctomycetaceae bacterium]
MESDRNEMPQCGAFGNDDGSVTWRVWAPRARRADLVLFAGGGISASIPLEAEPRGFFSCARPGIVEGRRYAFRLDGGAERPDPASRWQPEGVHCPSAVFFPERFPWTDADWRGIRREDLVIYELHVGTFTDTGTFDAIVPRLAALRDLGITAIELMPVAQFPGDRGWGYDGVHPFAVQNSYGGPQGLQRLVDACHRHGLGVILDVVYNHLGPEGNYAAEFGPYFSDHHHTPWGNGVNFDDRGSDAVRAFVLQNVRQWVRDFHLDGLRLDAIDAICDFSAVHILRDIKETAAQEARRLGWPVHVIAESCLNDVRLLDDVEHGGYGLDAQWSDDFHHSVHALLTGERHGYYADFGETAQLVKALNSTFVNDGRYSRFRDRRHGAPVGNHSGDRFVVSIQNHDQIGNRAQGDRFGTLLSPACQRLAAGLLLLAPHLPLLFMGEEYGETRPFPFFCSFIDDRLIAAVRRGRREEFAQFNWQGDIPDPQSSATFASARLSWSWPEESRQAGLRRLYRDLLAARRSIPGLGDFRHRSAEMNDAHGGPLLRLVRGDGNLAASPVEIWFNLSDRPVRLPDDRIASAQKLLLSESREYGGRRDGSKGDADHVLLPCKFVIFARGIGVA